MHPDDINAGLCPDMPIAQKVPGGATRQASVHNGLAAVSPRCETVLIHDAARPGVSHTVIDRVLDALQTHDAAAPALAVTDALWRGSGGIVQGTVDRDRLYRAQTPQGFVLSVIKDAHNAFQGDAADDVEIARAAGVEVAITAGDEDNLKITTPEDFARAQRILEARHAH